MWMSRSPLSLMVREAPGQVVPEKEMHMTERMTRGKNQVLYNYLPERTIDFQNGGAIARITRIVGIVPQDLTRSIVVERIAQSRTVILFP